MTARTFARLVVAGAFVWVSTACSTADDATTDETSAAVSTTTGPATSLPASLPATSLPVTAQPTTTERATATTTSGAPADDADGGGEPVVVTATIGFRDYTVVVPSRYDGTALPLVMMLHGYTASGALQESYFRLGPLAESRGFLLVYPDGTFDPVGNRFWNATDACCDFTGAAVDDVAHLLAIIDAVSDEYAVDADRVHLVGHSNGGFMAYRMACEHADVVASMVSLAGATFASPDDCRPSEPVGVVQVHGTRDDVIRYAGGATPLGGVYPSAADTVASWARSNGCETEVDGDASGPVLDLDAGIDGADTSVISFGGCPDEGFVELWTIEGGSHVPPLTDEFRARVVDVLLEGGS